MRRVVVTGMGIVSSIGNNTQEVLGSLREAKSGIVARRAIRRARLPLPGARRADARSGRRGRPPRHALSRPRRGLESRRHGAGDPRRRRRAERHLERAHRHHHGLGRAFDPRPSSKPPTSRARRAPKRVGPFAVPKAMSSTASATLATWFKIKGVNYSISSACATSNHCIGNAAELIQLGQAGHDLRRRLARSSTGRCRTCSTPWARCRRNSTTRRRRPRAPMTPTATAS